MANHRGRRTAGAMTVFREREEFPRRPFPLAVVTALAAVRALPVEAGLALRIAHGDLRAALTGEVNTAAMAAGARGADGHDQATGASAGVPSAKTAPAAIDVPPVLVITARR